MICPENLAALVTAAAISLSQGKSAEEVELLSSVLIQLADTLATIAAGRALSEAQKQDS